MDKKIKKFLKKIWWFMFSLLTLVGGVLTGFPVCNNNYVYVTANNTPTEHICRRRVSQNPKECNTCSTASEKEPITMSFNINIVREYLVDPAQYSRKDEKRENEENKMIIDYVFDYIIQGAEIVIISTISLIIYAYEELVKLKRKIIKKIIDEIIEPAITELIDEEKENWKDDLKKYIKNQKRE